MNYLMRIQILRETTRKSYSHPGASYLGLSTFLYCPESSVFFLYYKCVDVVIFVAQYIRLKVGYSGFLRNFILFFSKERWQRDRATIALFQCLSAFFSKILTIIGCCIVHGDFSINCCFKLVNMRDPFPCSQSAWILLFGSGNRAFCCLSCIRSIILNS